MRMMNTKAFQNRFLRRLDNQLHLRQLLDCLPEVFFWAKNRLSQFVMVNRALLNMSGLKHEEEMIGKTDYDFSARDLADQYVEEDRRVMRGGVPVVNQAWLVSDCNGELKWYICRKIPLFGDGGKVIGSAGVMRDYEKADTVLEPYREMEKVVKYVFAKYAEKIDVRRLAAMAHLSVSQFDRKFKQVFQMTPQQFILRVRINAACRALTSTDQTVAQIAHRTGFYDQSYFTKQFRRQTGATPVAYRNKYRSGGTPPGN